MWNFGINSGRFRPWDRVGVSLPAFTAVHVYVGKLHVASKETFFFLLWKFFVIQLLPNARFWIRLWVNFRVVRGWMPRDMLSSTSWPSSSKFWPLLGRDRSCLEGNPVCHLNPCPALGCEGWQGGVGKPLWERRLGAPGGAFRIGISCAFKKFYPFWTCLWMQLARSQDRF